MGYQGEYRVLHRVVETDKTADMENKGDANEVSDPGAVSYEHILEK